MTTILQEAAAGRASIVAWTVEYHRAIESGLVPEDTAVELLDAFGAFPVTPARFRDYRVLLAAGSQPVTPIQRSISRPGGERRSSTRKNYRRCRLANATPDPDFK